MYTVFYLLFNFWPKSRAFPSFSFNNLPLHSLVLFLTYIMLPSYIKWRAFGFNFIRQSNIPKSLSRSIFVVTILWVSSLSYKFSVTYFPFSGWSNGILFLAISKSPEIISGHCFAISSNAPQVLQTFNPYLWQKYHRKIHRLETYYSLHYILWKIW